MNNGRICVSVCAETALEAAKKVGRARQIADIVEIRIDCLPDSEVGPLLDSLPSIDQTYLLTYRSTDQGGHSSKSRAERVAFLHEAVARLGRDRVMVDLEYDGDDLPLFPNVDSVVSYHDFAGVPESLDKTFHGMRGTGAAVLKVACFAHDADDAIAVWNLAENISNVIPIAMSEAGLWTRILSNAYGSPFTFAAHDDGEETAPGQVTARDMIDLYRVKQLDRQTEVYGVIGNPIGQSLSPHIHNAAFAHSLIDAVFIPFFVRDLDKFVTRFIARETREVELNLRGFAVTMPFKQAILPYLDSINDTANAIGAVNTIKIEDDQLRGCNTDAEGFLVPLKKRFGSLTNARVAVIGAGGAARACVYALQNEGAAVKVFVRDPIGGTELGEKFDIEMGDLAFANLDGFDILVNATPVGMTGAPPLLRADELTGLKLVYDLVTGRGETALCKEAQIAAVPFIGGIEMLIAQAAMQFEIWTGLPAPATVMKRAAISRIADRKG
jgi:3-dehydroquinate dehydratase/shikimate dehydrogenase